MIPLHNRVGARSLDQHAIEAWGIGSEVLMENAGLGAFRFMGERYPGRLGRVVLVGGPGQNGGDAWVVARQLLTAGHKCTAILLGEPSQLAGAAAANWAVLERIGARREVVQQEALQPLAEALGQASLVVDGLFGTGLTRPVSGVYEEAVAMINACGVPCVALDLPSGVDADTGAVLGVAVKAEATVTFAVHKLGLAQFPAAALAGEVRLAPIGVPSGGVPPRGPWASAAAEGWQLSDVPQLVPPRAAAAHKGSAGRVLVVAGSDDKAGAALLAARGALRGGAGLATLATWRTLAERLVGRLPELMLSPLDLPASAAGAAALALAAGQDAVVLGPGLGLDAEAQALARVLAQELPVPTVIDADALTALADGALADLRSAAAPRVLTPHPGEAARLLSCTTAEVQADRPAAAQRLAELSGQVVVLKGAGSLAAQPGRPLRVVSGSLPALATPGAGDVLGGLMAALLAGGLGTLDAGTAGPLIHEAAARGASQADRGLLASEVADWLPQALTQALSTV